MSLLYRRQLNNSPFLPFEQLLSRSLSATPDQNKEVIFTPRVDIHETGESYQLVAELPGVEKEQIDITVEDSTLTISASNQTSKPVTDTEQASETDQIIKSERRFGCYQRSFSLGENIDQENINARFNNGLLALTIPKAAPQDAQTQRIEIH